MEFGYMLGLNFILLGCLVILFTNARRLYREVEHLKRFCAVMLDYIEKETGQTPPQIRDGLNKFIDELNTDKDR